jgi:hypothetical protein
LSSFITSLTSRNEASNASRNLINLTSFHFFDAAAALLLSMIPGLVNCGDAPPVIGFLTKAGLGGTTGADVGVGGCPVVAGTVGMAAGIGACPVRGRVVHRRSGTWLVEPTSSSLDTADSV